MATTSQTALEIMTETPQQKRLRHLQTLIAEYQEEAGLAYRRFLDAPKGSEERSAFQKRWFFAASSVVHLQGMLGEDCA
jgi:hypothetical protein